MKTILQDLLRGVFILAAAATVVGLIWLVFGILMPAYPVASACVIVPLLCWGLGYAFKLWAV